MSQLCLCVEFMIMLFCYVSSLSSLFSYKNINSCLLHILMFFLSFSILFSLLLSLPLSTSLSIYLLYLSFISHPLSSSLSLYLSLSLFRSLPPSSSISITFFFSPLSCLFFSFCLLSCLMKGLKLPAGPAHRGFVTCSSVSMFVIFLICVMFFCFVQGGPGSVQFGYGLGVERFEQFRFSVPEVPLQKRFSVFQYSLTGKDGSGFGS